MLRSLHNREFNSEINYSSHRPIPRSASIACCVGAHVVSSYVILRHSRTHFLRYEVLLGELGADADPEDGMLDLAEQLRSRLKT